MAGRTRSGCKYFERPTIPGSCIPPCKGQRPSFQVPNVYLISIVASPTRLAWRLIDLWLVWACVRRLTVEADGRSDPLFQVHWLACKFRRLEKLGTAHGWVDGLFSERKIGTWQVKANTWQRDTCKTWLREDQSLTRRPFQSACDQSL